MACRESEVSQPQFLAHPDSDLKERLKTIPRYTSAAMNKASMVSS